MRKWIKIAVMDNEQLMCSKCRQLILNIHDIHWDNMAYLAFDCNMDEYWFEEGESINDVQDVRCSKCYKEYIDAEEMAMGHTEERTWGQINHESRRETIDRINRGT